MFDRIFAPALTFVMLIGGTGAMVAAMFFEPRPEVSVVQGMPPQTIMLEEVVITGKRAAAEPATKVKDKRTALAGQAAEGRGVLLRQPRY
jgi:hypothetical protein